jgi:hypothetical protein
MALLALLGCPASVAAMAFEHMEGQSRGGVNDAGHELRFYRAAFKAGRGQLDPTCRAFR